MLVGRLGLKYERLDALLKLLHDVLVFQLSDVALFSLDVCVEQRAFLCDTKHIWLIC